MLTILPSLNCHSGDQDCVQNKLGKISKFADWVHLDIADGTITFNRTWGDSTAWKSFRKKPKLEVHLMVADVLNILPAWLMSGAKRVVIQFEHLNNRSELEKIIGLCKTSGAQVVLSVLPETPIALLEEYHPLVKCYQVFSQSDLGPPGQKFLPIILSKIAELRKRFPKAYIEVDGGINLETGRLSVLSGANALVSGSYIFNSPDPKKSYRELLSLYKIKKY